MDWLLAVIVVMPLSRWTPYPILHPAILFLRNHSLSQNIEGHTGRINTVSFSPNSKIITSGSSDQTIKLWQLDGTLIDTFVGHSDSVASVNFNPDGKAIASVDRDGKIKLWRLDASPVTKLTAHKGRITGIRFSPNLYLAPLRIYSD